MGKKKSDLILKQGGGKERGGKSPLVNIVMTSAMLEAVEDYQWKNRITRSEACRQLIQKGLKKVAFFERNPE